MRLFLSIKLRCAFAAEIAIIQRNIAIFSSESFAISLIIPHIVGID